MYTVYIPTGDPSPATHTQTLLATLVPAQSGARPRWLRFSITGIRRALQHKVIVAGCSRAWCGGGGGGRVVGGGGVVVYTGLSLAAFTDSSAMVGAVPDKVRLGGLSAHEHTLTLSRSLKAPTH